MSYSEHEQPVLLFARFFIYDDIALLLYYTVLKTTTYLKFCYIKLKNTKQKEEKKTDVISEKVKPILVTASIDFA